MPPDTFWVSVYHIPVYRFGPEH